MSIPDLRLMSSKGSTSNRRLFHKRPLDELNKTAAAPRPVAHQQPALNARTTTSLRRQCNDGIDVVSLQQNPKKITLHCVRQVDPGQTAVPGAPYRSAASYPTGNKNLVGEES